MSWEQPVINIETLKSLTPLPGEGATVFVLTERRDYWWDPKSKDPDNSDTDKTYIRPNSLLDNTYSGRWRTKIAGTGTSGSSVTIAATVSDDNKYVIITEPADGDRITIQLKKSAAFNSLFTGTKGPKAVQIKAWESPIAVPTVTDWGSSKWKGEFPPQENLHIDYRVPPTCLCLTCSTWNPLKSEYRWDRTTVSLGVIANGILPIILEGF